MNEAALLAACDAAPADPVPRLVLADCLEEAGTPGRAALARWLRRSAKALQNGGAASQERLRRGLSRLARERPSAVAWFEWWSAKDVAAIIALHKGLDRRRLARFVIRCARETTPSRGGGAVADHLNPAGRTALGLLERFSGGHDLTESDWLTTSSFLPPDARVQWRTSISHVVCESLGNVSEAIDPQVLALADPEVPTFLARWAAVDASSRCAGAFAAGFDGQQTVRELHRRLLHECVPCPFDPEGDE